MSSASSIPEEINEFFTKATPLWKVSGDDYDGGPKGFLDSLRKYHKDHPEVDYFALLESTLPEVPESLNRFGEGHFDFTDVNMDETMKVYAKALKFLTSSQEELSTRVVDLLVNRKLISDVTPLRGKDPESIMAHFSSILQEDPPEQQAYRYIQNKHFLAIVALYILALTFPDEKSLPKVVQGIFERLKKSSDPQSLDNENYGGECDDFFEDMSCFNRLHGNLCDLTALAQSSYKKQGSDSSSSGSPVEQLVDWTIRVADNSYYENRNNLVYDLYDTTYDHVAELDPVLTVRKAHDWMQRAFPQEGEGWSHRTAAMAYLLGQGVKELSEQDVTELTPTIQAAMDYFVDKETNAVKENSCECQDESEFREAHRIIATKLGLPGGDKKRKAEDSNP